MLKTWVNGHSLNKLLMEIKVVNIHSSFYIPDKDSTIHSHWNNEFWTVGPGQIDDIARMPQ